MSRELENYKKSGSVVIKSSPAESVKTHRKISATEAFAVQNLGRVPITGSQAVHPTGLRHSMSQNMHSVNKVLKQSERVVKTN